MTRKVRGPTMVFADAKSFGCLRRTGSTQMEKPEHNYLYFSPLFCCLFFKHRGLAFDHIQFLILCYQCFHLQYSLVSSLLFSKDPLLVFSVTSSISLILFPCFFYSPHPDLSYPSLLNRQTAMTV